MEGRAKKDLVRDYSDREKADGDEDRLGSPQTPSPPRAGMADASGGSGSTFTSPTSMKDGGGGGFDVGERSERLGPHSPNTRTRLLPPTTPKSRASEMFLSPSPTLRSPATQATPKDSDKPIREISQNLKTRLNYAFMKLQNGWQDKTLPELETELEVSGSPRKRHERSPTSDKQNSYEYCNKYASPGTDDEAMLDDTIENSAQSAFLKALASPKKKPRSISTEYASPPQLPIIRPSSSSRNEPSEVEAIETLMSLSASQKNHPVVAHEKSNGNNSNYGQSSAHVTLNTKPYNLSFPPSANTAFHSRLMASNTTTTTTSDTPRIQGPPFSSALSDTESLTKALVKPFGLAPSSIEHEHQQRPMMQQPLQPTLQPQPRHAEVQTDVETDVEEVLTSDTDGV